jgi:lipopolysaccharide transport system permease protein
MDTAQNTSWEAPDAVLDFTAGTSVAGRNRLAVQDVVEGTRLWPLALTLGWLDIKLRYRGSMLGPFWLTLSTGVMVAGLGLLYSVLFHMDIHDYLPFLTLSQVLWGFIAGMVGEGCTCFTQAEGVIRSVRMPMFVQAIRTLIRNVLVLAHNIVVIVVVFAIYRVWPGWHAILALPGLALWMVDSIALCLLLGTFCTRFRDIGPIVGSIMQIAFFMTPVIWKAEQVGSAAMWMPLNPFYGLLEVVRAPLLGGAASVTSWLAALVYSGLLCLASWSMFVRARARVAFWL